MALGLANGKNAQSEFLAPGRPRVGAMADQRTELAESSFATVVIAAVIVGSIEVLVARIAVPLASHTPLAGSGGELVDGLRRVADGSVATTAVLVALAGALLPVCSGHGGSSWRC